MSVKEIAQKPMKKKGFELTAPEKERKVGVGMIEIVAQRSGREQQHDDTTLGWKGQKRKKVVLMR